MSEIRVRQGDTLSLMVTFQDDSGAPIDLSTVALTGWVRAPDDTIVAKLTLVPAAAEGVVTITADTTQWPIGRLRSDIKAVSAGVTEHTETFAIYIGRSVTP